VAHDVGSIIHAVRTLLSGGALFKKPGGKNKFGFDSKDRSACAQDADKFLSEEAGASTQVRAGSRLPRIACSEGDVIMVSLVLTIIGFAGAMTVPVFLTAFVESAAAKIRPSSIRFRERSSFSTVFRHSTVTAPAEYRRALG
jgi:hypothetical protein